MISFLMPWRDVGDLARREAKEFVCKRLEADWPNAEMLVGSNPGLFERTATINGLAAWAKNPIFVVIDADTYVDYNALAEMVDLVRHSQAWGLPYDRYYSLTKHGTEEFIWHGPSHTPEGAFEYEYVFPSTHTPEPAVSGCVVVHQRAFESVHGFDERFQGWGEEDRAFVLSLVTFFGTLPRCRAPLYHLWHPMAEADRFGQPNFQANRQLCNRYREAAGDIEKMGALVGER